MLWIGLGIIVMAISMTVLVFSGAGDAPFSYTQYLLVGAIFFATGMIVETIKAAEYAIVRAIRPNDNSRKEHKLDETVGG